MEKLIYVLAGARSDTALELSAFADEVVPAARAIGGHSMAVLLPDQAEEIRRRCPARISPRFETLAGAFEVWLPTLDPRASLEEALRGLSSELWGYLVCESTMAACPHAVGEGERVLYHHLIEGSETPATAPGRGRPETRVLCFEGVPGVSPYRLDQGPEALRYVRERATAALADLPQGAGA